MGKKANEPPSDRELGLEAENQSLREQRFQKQIDDLKEKVVALTATISGGDEKYVTRREYKAARGMFTLASVVIVALLTLLWNNLQGQLQDAKSSPDEMAAAVVRQVHAAAWEGLGQARTFSQAEQHELNLRDGSVVPRLPSSNSSVTTDD